MWTLAVLTGCNLNQVRTRCERGPSEVRNPILGKTDPLSLLTDSLVATRFRMLSAVEQKRKPSQAAVAACMTYVRLSA